MNKMAKGAIATGLGVALLIGGGGTLAVWNEQVEAKAGTVAAGNLDLDATAAGTWSSDMTGSIDDIGKYHVVPGETLTYRQNINVTLEGKAMKAMLGVVNLDDAASDFDAANIVVTPFALTKQGGTPSATVDLVENAAAQPIAAMATFEFKASTGDAAGKGLDDVGAQYDLSDVAFKLDQVAPTAPTSGQ